MGVLLKYIFTQKPKGEKKKEKKKNHKRWRHREGKKACFLCLRLPPPLLLSAGPSPPSPSPILTKP